MKILLVEDHPALAKMTTSLLSEVHDHHVETVSTGEAALMLASDFHPEIVLSDINLPGMDGYELAKRLRRIPALTRTVLVALTGFGNLIDEKRVGSAGFDTHFRKPMDFDLLPTLKRREETG